MVSRPLLYYITDRSQFTGDETSRRRQLLEKVAEATRWGVDYIQLREKDLSVRHLQDLAREVKRLIEDASASSARHNAARTRLLINSRTDVALTAKADGVHLRSEDVSPADVREITRSVLTWNRELETRNFLVSVSCHSEEEVVSAARHGADFVVYAPVFEKRVDQQVPATGLDQLRVACGHNVPVFALGGVTLENARSCLEAGAAGIAGIRLFQQNPIADVVRALRGG